MCNPILNSLSYFSVCKANLLVTMKIKACSHLFSYISWISQTTQGPVNVPVFQPVCPLPSLQFQVERVNVEHSVPMYAPELVSAVSSFIQPSDNPVHHCYAHLYLKVRSIPLFIPLFKDKDLKRLVVLFKWDIQYITVHLIIILINFVSVISK